ncbi:MAG: bifunctional riboflavin kinase/FAD synthetase [Alphaproteobacteria bacterium]
MQVFTDFSDYQNDGQSWVVALGNFDGVHKGHQAVIERAKILAKKLGAKTAVVTFEPHPKHYFNPDLPPFRLTPRKTKRFFINKLGVDAIFELEFNKNLAQTEAYDFVKDILVGKFNAAAVVTGYDFHFGKNRKGTPQFMATMAKEFGFDYICIDAITDENGISWSASRIREALANGDINEAIEILGRPFMFQGEVIHGQALGRTIGFPTANVLPLEYLRPMKGVYAVKAKIIGEDDIWRDAIANIGNRPTVEGQHHTLIEVHLLNWDGDLYGKRLRTALLGFVRKEQKFDGIESLKQQIEKDVTVTKEILAQYQPNSLKKK